MFKNTIGCNIRKYREEMEWNQQELAKRIHTSRQSVSAYERGAAQPDIYTLIHIADTFHVTLDDLTGHRPPEKLPRTGNTLKSGTQKPAYRTAAVRPKRTAEKPQHLPAKPQQQKTC